MNKISFSKLILFSFLCLSTLAFAQIITVKSGFTSPKKVAVDGSGNIYILDGDTIKKMDANGNGLATIGNAFPTTYDFALDSNGNFYVALAALEVQKMTANGSSVSSFTTFPSNTDGPGGITVDASNNVYVADTENNQIIKLDTAGNTSQSFVASGINQPIAITTDLAGNIYAGIYNGTNFSIIKIPSTGGSGTVIKSGISSIPLSLAVDNSGNIYYIELGGSTIKRVNSTGGNLVTIASGFNFSPGGGLAIDSTNNIFIADYGNGAIKKIAAVNLGVINVNSSAAITLSPNPAKDYTVVNNVTKGTKVALYDATGKLLYQTTATGSTLTLTTSAYSNGVYIVSVGGKTLKLLISK